MQNTQTPKLDLEGFVLGLMEELGIEKNDLNKENKVFQQMLEQAKHRTMEAITLTMEADQLEETLANHGDSNDIQEFIEELVKISPQCQVAILEALENFREEVQSFKAGI